MKSESLKGYTLTNYQINFQLHKQPKKTGENSQNTHKSNANIIHTPTYSIIVDGHIYSGSTDKAKI